MMTGDFKIRREVIGDREAMNFYIPSSVCRPRFPAITSTTLKCLLLLAMATTNPSRLFRVYIKAAN